MEKLAKEKIPNRTICGDSPLVREQTLPANLAQSPALSEYTATKIDPKGCQSDGQSPIVDKVKAEESSTNCSFPTEKLIITVGGSGDYESSPCAVAAWAVAAAAWLAAKAIFSLSKAMLPYTRNLAAYCRNSFDYMWENESSKHREVMLFVHGSLTAVTYIFLGTVYTINTITDWFVQPTATIKPNKSKECNSINNNDS